MLAIYKKNKKGGILLETSEGACITICAVKYLCFQILNTVLFYHDLLDILHIYNCEVRTCTFNYLP